LIDPTVVRQFAKTTQTTELNVAREYCQHLFLSAFYRQKGSERVLFKGGTALRLVHGSPRFSEDLDFSGFGVNTKAIEDWVVNAAAEMEKTGIEINLRESKRTSGGYLAILECAFSSYRVQIQIEVSLRKSNGVRGKGVLIASELVPSYTVVILPEHLLVAEKLAAAVSRSKPRDFFDVYFLLRKGLIPPDQRRRLNQVRERLANSRENLRTELQDFLPQSYHGILRDFKESLLRELDLYR
jgi:predicted nucleotidyltransferase component of viral defense system